MLFQSVGKFMVACFMVDLRSQASDGVDWPILIPGYHDGYVVSKQIKKDSFNIWYNIYYILINSPQDIETNRYFSYVRNATPL